MYYNYMLIYEKLHYIVRFGPSLYIFSCSTQLSIKFILLINDKMLAISGIYTFISMLNTCVCLKAGTVLSEKSFTNSRPALQKKIL